MYADGRSTRESIPLSQTINRSPQPCQPATVAHSPVTSPCSTRYCLLQWLTLAALLSIAGQAAAVPVSFAGPEQDFEARLSVNGTLTSSVSANFTLSTSIPLFGTASTSGAINLSSSGEPVQLLFNPGGIYGSPTGSANIVLPDEGPAGAGPPSTDGRNFASDGTLPSRLSDAMLTDLDVRFVESSTSIFEPVTLTGTTALDVAGLFDIPIDTIYNSKIDMDVNDLRFQQSPGNDGIIGPSVSLGDNKNDRSQEYPVVAPEGTLSGEVHGDMSAGITWGIFGVFIKTINLSTLASTTQDFSESATFPGGLTLLDLSPGGYTGFPGDDLGFRLDDDGLLSGTLLDGLGFSLSGSQPINTNADASMTIDGFGTLTFDVDIVGSVNMDLVTTGSIGDLTYHLEDDVADVVSPEPGGILLAVFGVLAILPAIARRIRGM